MSTPDCRLYLITPPAISDLAAFARELGAAMDGGDVGAVQLRLKGCGDDVVAGAARALAPIVRARGAPLILNDRPDLAAELDCDGVHIGQDDAPYAEARRLMGRERIVGVTCHDSLHLAMEAAEAGADYVAFGAFFPTTTKDAKTTADPELLEGWQQGMLIPCVAIGGITPGNCRALVTAGADFIAVSGAVWTHPEGPGAAVTVFNAEIAAGLAAPTGPGIAVASLTARVVQSLARTLLARPLPTDEAAMREALRRALLQAKPYPPASLDRQCAVSFETVEGRRIYTLSPLGGGGRGHVLYFPGGGYVHPPGALHWSFAAGLVKRLGVTCTVPLYPLAPEHHCDEAIAFTVATYRRLETDHGAQNVVVMGDSAGGGLALATVQQAQATPAGLMLNAPWLDAGASDPSQVELERVDFILSRFSSRTWGAWWAGERSQQDPMASPLFGDMSRLPPTLLFCGSADILVADARRLAAAAPDKVRYIEEPGLVHVYPMLQVFPEARRAIRMIDAFVREVLPA